MPHPHSTIKTENTEKAHQSGVLVGFVGRGLTLSSFGCLDMLATDGQRRGPR